MGANDTPVTVRSATLAGGSKNQDRYAHGDGWAFVVDGASSFGGTGGVHDGGWYADRLRNALAGELAASPEGRTQHLVMKAIEAASRAHPDPQTCPTSTVALARWTTENVEVFVLGDSTAAVVFTDDERVICDSRIGRVGADLREEYRARLREGQGFDDGHREILSRLQAQQAAARNVPGGYWIAGASPEAAKEALTSSFRRDQVDSLALATDGAATVVSRYHLCHSWQEMLRADLGSLLFNVRDIEESDPRGVKYPRSKIHDDATVVAVTLPAHHKPGCS